MKSLALQKRNDHAGPHDLARRSRSTAVGLATRARFVSLWLALPLLGCPTPTPDGDGPPVVEDSGVRDGPFPLDRAMLSGSHLGGNAWQNFCHLSIEGEVTCFGHNVRGGSNVPEGVRFTKIEVSNFFTCGLTPEGQILCWGDEDTLNGGPPTADTRFIDFDLNNSEGCGLTEDHRIQCFGLDDVNGQIPEGVTFSAVSGGIGAFCAIREDNRRLECWGFDGPEFGTLQPPEGEFRDVWLSDGVFACAERVEGGLVCWGDRKDEQGEEIALQTAPTVGEFRDLAFGYAAICGLTTTGQVVCWGDPDELPPGPTDGGDYVSLTRGSGSSCALRADDTIVCTGGVFGGGGLPPNMTAARLQGGGSLFCGADEEGEVLCWGAPWVDWPGINDVLPPMGEISVGAFRMCGVEQPSGEVRCYGSVSLDDRAPGPAAFSDLSAAGGGNFPLCGILAGTGEIACWGSGVGFFPDWPEGTFSEIDGGFGFHCALDTAGEPHCWGANGYVAEPTAVSGPLHGLDCGEQLCCALDAADAPVCWGPWAESMKYPVDAAFESVVAGWTFACGLTAEGSLRCWGENRYSESDHRDGPFTAVAASGQILCAQPLEGPVQCFGAVEEGHYSRYVPTRPSDYELPEE